MRQGLFVVFLSVVGVCQGLAGVLWVNETTYGSRQVVRSTTLVGTNAVRVDVAGDQKHNTVIYRADKKCFYMVDTKGKTYTEVTKERVDALAAQMDSAHEDHASRDAQDDDGQDGGSPDRRSKIREESLRREGGSVDGDPYEAQGEKELRKMWTVPYSSMNLGASDLAALKDFGAFFEKFGSNRGDYFKFDRSDLGFAGIPVKTVLMEGGKVKVTSELKDAMKKDFPPRRSRCRRDSRRSRSRTNEGGGKEGRLGHRGRGSRGRPRASGTPEAGLPK
jgi:hypothetical protein